MDSQSFLYHSSSEGDSAEDYFDDESIAVDEIISFGSTEGTRRRDVPATSLAPSVRVPHASTTSKSLQSYSKSDEATRSAPLDHSRGAPEPVMRSSFLFDNLPKADDAAPLSASRSRTAVLMRSNSSHSSTSGDPRAYRAPLQRSSTQNSPSSSQRSSRSSLQRSTSSDAPATLNSSSSNYSSLARNTGTAHACSPGQIKRAQSGAPRLHQRNNSAHANYRNYSSLAPTHKSSSNFPPKSTSIAHSMTLRFSSGAALSPWASTASVPSPSKRVSVTSLRNMSPNIGRALPPPPKPYSLSSAELRFLSRVPPAQREAVSAALTYAVESSESDELFASEESYESDGGTGTESVYLWVDEHKNEELREFWADKEQGGQGEAKLNATRLGSVFQQWIRQKQLPPESPFRILYEKLSSILISFETSRTSGEPTPGLYGDLTAQVQQMKTLLLETLRRLEMAKLKQRFPMPNLDKLDFHCQSLKLLSSVTAKYAGGNGGGSSFTSAVENFTSHLQTLFDWFVAVSAALKS